MNYIDPDTNKGLMGLNMMLKRTHDGKAWYWRIWTLRSDGLTEIIRDGIRTSMDNASQEMFRNFQELTEGKLT